MFDRDEVRGLTALVVILIIIFSVLIGLYLTSLSPTGQTYVLTLNSFHDNVEISIYNPLPLGKLVINKGNTELSLPEGSYKIVAKLHRDYTTDTEWKCSINLNCDQVVKVFD